MSTSDGTNQAPNTERPTDLISLKDAAKIVPSPYGNGRGVHLATLRRWVQAGKLRYWKTGPWYFVSRAEVLDLFTEVPKPAPKPSPAEVKAAEDAEAAARTARTNAVLKRHGLLR